VNVRSIGVTVGRSSVRVASELLVR